MMLVGIDGSAGRLLDLTALDAETLDRLHGRRVATRNGYEPICQGCHRPIHLVRNHHGTVFFRHDPGHAPDCIVDEVIRRSGGGGESAEHIEGKVRLVTAMRGLEGWSAQPEQRFDLAGETVIVDVAAAYADIARHTWQGAFAWEIQLAAQTAGEYAERSRTIAAVAQRPALWLTPHLDVGGVPAMICSPDATMIVDRILDHYEPRIPAQPQPVDAVVRSVHRYRPGHRWFRMGEEGHFHVVDIAAFATGATPPTPSRRRRNGPYGGQVHEPCDRPPIDLPPRWQPTPLRADYRGSQPIRWTPIDVEYPYSDNGPNICAVCGCYVAAPWGFTFDPPMCHEHFQARQNQLLERDRVRPRWGRR